MLDIPNILKINASSWLYPSTFLYLLHLKASPPSLFLSPGGRAFRRADPKRVVFVLCWAIFFDFLAFQNVARKMLRKNIEKSAKIEDLGFRKPSQNPPKIPLKSMSPKTCIFSSIFARFLQFAAKADSGSDPLGMVFCAHQTIFFKMLCAWILGPKNLPRNTPKRNPSLLKIDAKNVLFFNIDFFMFWS